MGPKRVCDDRKNAFQRIKYVYAKNDGSFSLSCGTRVVNLGTTTKLF